MKTEFNPYTIVRQTENEIILEFKGAKLRMARFTFRIMPILFFAGVIVSVYFLKSIDGLPWFVYLAHSIKSHAFSYVVLCFFDVGRK